MALTGTTEAKDWLGQPGWLTAARQEAGSLTAKGPRELEGV